MAIVDHEAEVAAFFAQAEATDPERYALVCSKHVVLSVHQMNWRLRREIPVGDDSDVELIGRIVLAADARKKSSTPAKGRHPHQQPERGAA
ncbi:MAG: hypothetical protein KGR26_00390 [Cyanobacteria bacterium REEB65]|nr:hypothetical protein [Cyanobacteria bacterium REEB65]